jgi:hypothetical protein
MKPKSFTQAVQEFQNRQRRLGRLFLSDNGQELLDLLAGYWYHGDLLDEDAAKTAFNLGAREVVKLLINMRDSAQAPEEKK